MAGDRAAGVASARQGYWTARMRVVFSLYLGLIVAGLVLYMVIGLVHH
jgi:hypothetical protein